jgi:glycosyltransferase involved in cell wall biosynthesis
MKKRILISVSYYTPHLSGLTIAVENLAELLVQHDYHVTVLTTQHDKALPRKERVHDMEVVRVPYAVQLHKGFLLPTLPFVAFTQTVRSDVVLINLPQVEGWIIALIARMLKKKVFCYYHCDVSLGKGVFAVVLSFLLQMANALSLSLADMVLTSSEDFAQHSSLLQKYVNKAKVVPLVIPVPEINILALKELDSHLRPYGYKRGNNKLDENEGMRRKKFRIGFLGRMANEKGIEYLLDAIPTLAEKLGGDFVIVLAGPEQVIGEQLYKDKISNLLQKYQKQIVQLGQLKDEELGAFYQLLDVLVLPSVNNTEAFGMVQVESMYCGTPVVATDLPGVRVPVTMTGMGKIVPIKKSRALAEAVVEVVKNRKVYVQPREKISKLFSEEKIFKEYEQLLS